MKTAEDPALELALADAMRENIESTRIMDHVEPLKRVVYAYADQQVNKKLDDLHDEFENYGHVTRWTTLQVQQILEQFKIKQP